MPQAVRALRGTTTTEFSFRTPNAERRTPNAERTIGERRFERGMIGHCDERVD